MIWALRPSRICRSAGACGVLRAVIVTWRARQCPWSLLAVPDIARSCGLPAESLAGMPCQSHKNNELADIYWSKRIFIGGNDACLHDCPEPKRARHAKTGGLLAGRRP